MGDEGRGIKNHRSIDRYSDPNTPPTIFPLLSAVLSLLVAPPSPARPRAAQSPPSVEDLRASLRADHPTWKVSRRRVKKLHKRRENTREKEKRGRSSSTEIARGGGGGGGGLESSERGREKDRGEEGGRSGRRRRSVARAVRDTLKKRKEKKMEKKNQKKKKRRGGGGGGGGEGAEDEESFLYLAISRRHGISFRFGRSFYFLALHNAGGGARKNGRGDSTEKKRNRDYSRGHIYISFELIYTYVLDCICLDTVAVKAPFFSGVSR